MKLSSILRQISASLLSDPTPALYHAVRDILSHIERAWRKKSEHPNPEFYQGEFISSDRKHTINFLIQTPYVTGTQNWFYRIYIDQGLSTQELYRGDVPSAFAASRAILSKIMRIPTVGSVGVFQRKPDVGTKVLTH